MQSGLCKDRIKQIVWFSLECPERLAEYSDPAKFRQIFTLMKQGKKLDRPDYVKL